MKRVCEYCQYYTTTQYKHMATCSAPYPDWVDWLEMPSGANRVEALDGVTCDMWEQKVDD